MMHSMQSLDPKAAASPGLDPRSFDNRVILHGVSWDVYERILEVRGDHGGVRLTYLKGALELMSPSNDHEYIKKTIARLVEAYADELGIDLTGIGSWTVKRRELERGAEPDECYLLGRMEGHDKPELAIEVVWTSGGLDKLEVWRGLGVGEVWFWEEGAISVHLLRDDRYEVAPRSELLPSLDLALIARLATSDNQSAAVRELRRALREGK
jgi:Uma2 family endonuclease